MTFTRAVRSARERAQAAATARTARDEAIALAYENRPPGATWRSVVDLINDGLPERARFGETTARNAHRAWRNRDR